MGDRANIVIDDGGSRVFLYTHGAGFDLPAVLQAALARRLRWSDPQYLARIIFQQMLRGDMGETGFGISAVIHDNSYPLLIVDCAKQAVRIEAERRGKIHGSGKEFSFEDYVILKEVDWNTLDTGRAAYYGDDDVIEDVQ